MRVFVYEHLCAGAAGSLTPSLRREGWAMLSAVLADLAACPSVEVLLPPSPLVGEGGLGGVRGLTADSAQSHESTFRTLARGCEFALVIAPECEGVLFRLCRWAEEEGARLLGPSSEVVRLCADKLSLAETLSAQGVPTPATRLYTPEPPCPFPVVVKPRDGAGSQATFLVKNRAEFGTSPVQARLEGWQGELLVQPFLPGTPASIAVLGSEDGTFQPLLACGQDLTPGRFLYQGGRLPLSADLQERAKNLALRVARAVPGLRGYFGIDLVLGESPEQDAVIEVNPRLTTSYVGLRALARGNLAWALLQSAQGRCPPLDWQDGAVSFTADGSVSRS